MVASMQEIHAASSKIGEIIGTIDGITFQTNILPLNGAIEAARVGEQERGFAVVAGEVCSLSQRSAQAAREIETLITTNVDKVASGTKVVRGAGLTMTELVDNAKRMNDLLSEISTAASEQSDGVALVGSSVQQLINHMTQQNAALVEQTAAAASSLNNQAVDLADQVAMFRQAPPQAAALRRPPHRGGGEAPGTARQRAVRPCRRHGQRQPRQPQKAAPSPSAALS